MWTNCTTKKLNKYTASKRCLSFETCCCSPSETYWKEMGWLQFSDPYRTASSITGGWSSWDILMCFIYIAFWALRSLIFWPYGCHFFYKVSLFCIHFHFCKYTLHVCYVFSVTIWRILLMTDGLNAVWSNYRAAPTDTNPKNLELAPLQSVTTTRLDQLVYSPNYYI